MKYNSEKEHLIIREFGRNIQSLVQKAVKTKDRIQRNRLANGIVEIMAQMNPIQRFNEEYRHKMWDLLYVISDYKLDVDAPYPMPDKPEVTIPLLKHPGYPFKKIRMAHYGKHIEQVVDKAAGLKDEEKKKYLTRIIANYMKMSYTNWHKENVSDEIVFADLDKLSGGKLQIDRTQRLNSPPEAPRRRPTQGPRRGEGGTYRKRPRGK